MSIPLDRFYHYLDHSIDRDVIIYRWAPPGAKNLQELTPLRIYDANELARGVVVVAHDQEPLDLDQYNNGQGLDITLDSYNNHWQTHVGLDQWCWNHQQVLQSWIYPDLGDNVTDSMVLLHSEPCSAQQDQAQQQGWCTAWIWSNALISQDWFRYAQHDPCISRPRTPTETFLVYSRAWTHSREYRLWFLNQLALRGLAQGNRITFGTHDQDHCYRDHEFQHSQWRCQVTDLEQYFRVSEAPSWASADYDAGDYGATMIEVVLETVIDRVHLTEKTCRALACAQPFVLVAGAGSLAFLRHHGFETFGAWINEDYDLEHNDTARLGMILDEMSRIHQMPVTQKLAMYQHMYTVAQRNQQRFFSQDLQQQIMQQGITSLRDAVAQVPQQGQQLQRWRQVPGHRAVPVSR
jgi:hypothetical protein